MEGIVYTAVICSDIFVIKINSISACQVMVDTLQKKNLGIGKWPALTPIIRRWNKSQSNTISHIMNLMTLK